ncbi:MAG: hypothetical protein AAGD01_04440 [Acidobacteriota bacterium]
MSEQVIELSAERFQAPASLGRIQAIALVVGILGVASSAFFYTQDPKTFLTSYLVAWVFFLSISLGCLGLMMIQHLTQGDWGLTARRINEASAGTLVLLAVGFVPIALGMKKLFKWLDPDLQAHDQFVQAKLWFLNEPGFLGRGVLYFVVWCGLAFFLRHYSKRQEETRDFQWIIRSRRVSGFGIVALAVTATLASFDYLMSLDPHWYSSLYGVYFMGSCAVGGMTFMILIGTWLSQSDPMDKVLDADIFHAQGKLLLAFTMVWAYFTVSQLIITWSGNLPEEVLWYQHRTGHGWGVIAIGGAFLHFFVPFLLLLSRPLKRRQGTLVWVAALLLGAHWLDYFWQAIPNFREHFSLALTDVTTVLGIGGLWLWFFLFLFSKRPIAPIHDPYLPEAIER